MWFNVLPFHPVPYPLESFTSYLIRLAEGNHIRSKSGLSALVFPNQKRKNAWTDLPRQEYGALPTITTHPEGVFRATTFYHLACKLRRSVYPGPLKILLASSISKHLRFCPLCLSEHGYYSLLWRFTALPGCSKHQCIFLEACPNCHSSIPLLPTPLRFGVCPTCKHQLSDGATETLSMEASTQVEQLEQDLRFLLTQASWETDPEYLYNFGTVLATIRRERGWTQLQVAESLRIPRDAMSALEGRFSRGRGETFKDYLRYLQFLGTSFAEAFAATKHISQLDEGELWFERIQQTIEHFRTTRQPLTQQAICHYWGCQSKTLRQYPKVKTILRQLPPQRLAQRREILREQVERCVHDLQGQVITPERVAASLNLSCQSLKHYPEIWKYLMDFIPAKKKVPLTLSPLSDERKAILRQKVEAAIEHLLEQGEKITRINIYKHAHISPIAFCQYPLLKDLVKQATRPTFDPKLLNKDYLLEQVKRITWQLIEAGQPFTSITVAQMIGISPKKFWLYPEIHDFFKEQRDQQKLQRQAKWLIQVQAAVKYLQDQQLPVTQRGVAELLGISNQCLRYHSHLLDYLALFHEYNQHLHLQEQQARENKLRNEVLAAIRDMQANNLPITQMGVAQALNTSSQRLKSYPSIQPIMEEIKQHVSTTTSCLPEAFFRNYYAHTPDRSVE